MSRRMRVGCDTPVGVEFVTLEARGKGVIVTEQLVEAFARARHLKPSECELVLVTDEDSGRVMWPVAASSVPVSAQPKGEQT